MVMGSRYGVKIRKREREVIVKQKTLYECPACRKKKVHREGYAIWRCNSCGSKFAGGAYSLETSVGISARKTLSSQKPRK
jgi:ribosomal protein eL43